MYTTLTTSAKWEGGHLGPLSATLSELLHVSFELFLFSFQTLEHFNCNEQSFFLSFSSYFS